MRIGTPHPRAHQSLSRGRPRRRALPCRRVPKTAGKPNLHFPPTANANPSTNLCCICNKVLYWSLRRRHAVGAGRKPWADWTGRGCCERGNVWGSFEGLPTFPLRSARIRARRRDALPLMWQWVPTGRASTTPNVPCGLAPLIPEERFDACFGVSALQVGIHPPLTAARRSGVATGRTPHQCPARENGGNAPPASAPAARWRTPRRCHRTPARRPRRAGSGRWDCSAAG